MLYCIDEHLFGSYILTVIATAALFCVGPGDIMLGMLLIILSNIGFSYSESFVSSFLPGLGPSADLGKISGYAWGLGYFGGLISMAILICSVFFFIAVVIVLFVNEERGKMVACEHAGE